jgi:TonB family protein
MMHNNNIKIMKTKPTLTDDDISSHMDFEKLLEVHKAAMAVRVAPKWLKIVGFSAPAVLLVSAVIYAVWPLGEPTVSNQSNEQPHIIQVDSSAVEKPQIELKNEEIMDALPAENSKSGQTRQQLDPKISSKIPVVPVFVQAEPVNGYPELYAYFNRELKYPAEALKDSVQGVASVSFAIDQTGKSTDIRITNSLGEFFDQECKRVIESMPAWRAATVNGTPISTRMSIPLTFRINKN